MPIDWTTAEIEDFFELYKIEYSTETWYYTGADHPIVYGGNTYVPAAIKHGDINKESSIDRISLDISFPISSFATKFISLSPIYRTFITIFLYQDSSNVIVAYQGEVTKISLNSDNTCTAHLEEMNLLSTKLPSVLISPSCNHLLYDTGCGLLKASYKQTIVVDSVTNIFRIEAAALGGFPDHYFTRGLVEFGGDVRWVMRHLGTMIDLQMPFYDLEAGDSIDCYPGCDRNPETCLNKYNNLSNYLGCPYVPRKNPVLFGL